MNGTLYNLVMTFKNESNKNSQITIKNVRDDITSEEAKAAMAVIVSSNIFLTPLGNLTAPHSAELIAQTTTALNLA
ncbi:DUF2922 domain-containing protein [uncultured Clostridium sp.]|jgi:hypothetical protein|uniref:DUF2922 domain-containing protein n=1 Tax=uncultured Clostridium sp. TaxID=59620 RepID=UPI00260A6AC6|nr:DUF2922 domain-containing protein [uncultured Clostridium sp.]